MGNILKVICLFVLFVLFLNIPVYSEVIGYCPPGHYFVSWEPYFWQLGAKPGNAIENKVTCFTNGYVWRYQDTVYDTDFEGCQRSNWDSISSTNTGILLINTHGDGGGVIFLAVNSDPEKLLDSTSPYNETWSDDNQDGVEDYDPYWIAGSSGGLNYVYAYGSALETQHQSALASNKAIVIMQSCNVTKYTTSPLYHCYGRIGFGYPCTVNNDEGEYNMNLLFDLMNGTKPSRSQGSKREAIAAYNYIGSANWKKNFQYIIDNDTYKTYLNPTVKEIGIISDCYNESGGAGASGIVYIQFDSHMSQGETDGPQIEFSISGTVTISNVSWITDSRIQFSYSGGQPGYSVGVTVDGYYNRDTGGCHGLDGNRVTPTFDDYTFNFSY